MSNNKLEKRKREISIRVTDDELQSLHDRKTDTTLAGWMRSLCLGAKPINTADPNLIRALGRIGSNLNQIAKHTNIDNKLDENILTEIKAIREVLTNLTKQNIQDNDR